MSKSTKKKNYVSGGAKEIKFADGNAIINLDLKLEDLNSLPVSEKGYIRVVVAPRQSPDQYGNTHYVYENDFVPDKSKAKGGASAGGGLSKGPTVKKPSSGHPWD
jgi:hypothetical protein